VRWDDPVIGVEWPLGGEQPSLSDKDDKARTLAQAAVFD
jgi:dTDP-4-dehydrorhamnose 3,5-epimerase